MGYRQDLCCQVPQKQASRQNQTHYAILVLHFLYGDVILHSCEIQDWQNAVKAEAITLSCRQVGVLACFVATNLSWAVPGLDRLKIRLIQAAMQSFQLLVAEMMLLGT